MTTAHPHLHIHDHNFLGSTHDDNARRTLWVVALTTVMRRRTAHRCTQCPDVPLAKMLVGVTIIRRCVFLARSVRPVRRSRGTPTRIGHPFRIHLPEF
ncbi:MAG: hypothetical protein B7Y86_03445 [Brevundimonas subvibrioides]|uniref:Uncharacterized protein n=1 Tax=Brevundimonas subvibrioides TaxID=74313 RepID=A0A258HNA9_9CAUL|nr:MAG: hypothetical protein B7Y86_03445 [Brevundimonas subvibrioides]